VFPVERSGSQKFQGALDDLPSYHPSKRGTRVVDPREDLPKSILGYIEKRTGADNIVEQTRGQRQTGCNDLPGRVRELLKWMVRVESKKC